MIEIKTSLINRLKSKVLGSSWRLGGMLNLNIRTQINGVSFNVPFSHWTGDSFIDESYLRKNFGNTYAVLAALLPKTDGAVIDIGSNVGLFCYLVKSLDWTRQYVGFEVNVTSAAYLQMFIDLNGLPNASILPYGLYSQAGLFNLNLNSDLDVCATLEDAIRGKGFYSRERPVYVQPGDVLLNDICPSPEKIALIKIDIEGAEAEALRSLKDTILRCRPPVIMEILPTSSIAIASQLTDATSDDIASMQKMRTGHAKSIFSLFDSVNYRFFKMRSNGKFEPRTTLLDSGDDDPHEQDFLAIPVENIEIIADLVNY